MDLARWPLVKEHFNDALEREGDARRAYLDSLAPDLRRDVEHMLEAEAGFLDTRLDTSLLPTGVEGAGPTLPSSTSGDSPHVDHAAPLTGLSIGPYKVGARIGRGGMGDVYRARRADGLFERAVALKVVREGADTGTVLARFAAERRILGSLEHPGIARLIAAGAETDGPAAGRPWLALELVDGVPLTEAARPLDVEARVRLLIAVCEAVSYAHARLVVHRDLKPSNVLVARPRPAALRSTATGSTGTRPTETGPPGSPPPELDRDELARARVKLLDFGIAKLLDPEADDELTAEPARRPMTRAYAAPEQLRGDTPTTATDVYGLGLLLFEVLTGRKPFPPVGTRQEQKRAILEDAPPLASSVAEDGVPASRLRGDLDTICRTALAKAPEDRYASADALAADLRRWLAHEPIQARPPTAWYRTQRFVARHRTGVAASVLAAIVLAAGTMYYTVRLAQERDRARTAAAEAEGVAEVMAQMFDRDPFAADAERLDTVSVGRFVRDRGDAAVDELADQPAVQARLLSLLSRLHRQLGDDDRALVQAQRAVLIVDSIGRRPPRTPLPVAAQAHAELAGVLEVRGAYADAEPHYRRALGIVEALHGRESEQTAEALSNLSNVLIELGDSTATREAVRIAREALGIAQRTLGPDHIDVAQVHNNLSAQLYSIDRTEEALPHVRRALAIREGALGVHPLVGNTQSNLANYLHELGQTDEAVALFDDAIETYTATLGGEHPSLAAPVFGRAEALRDLERWDEAEAAARDALRRDAADLPPGHPFLAYDYTLIGEILVLRERWAAAEAELRTALRIWGSDASPSDLAETRALLGRCALRTGRPSEAVRLLDAALPYLGSRQLDGARADLAAAKRATRA